MKQSDEGPPRSANLPPGFDEDRPYEDEDLSDYPDWWRENIQEFQKYNLRPYRPPRFQDGELVPEVLSQVEDEYGVDVQILSTEPAKEQNWEFRVDGRVLLSFDKFRHERGYSVFQIDAEEVLGAVRKRLSVE